MLLFRASSKEDIFSTIFMCLAHFPWHSGLISLYIYLEIWILKNASMIWCCYARGDYFGQIWNWMPFYKPISMCAINQNCSNLCQDISCKYQKGKSQGNVRVTKIFIVMLFEKGTHKQQRDKKKKFKGPLPICTSISMASTVMWPDSINVEGCVTELFACEVQNFQKLKKLHVSKKAFKDWKYDFPQWVTIMRVDWYSFESSPCVKCMSLTETDSQLTQCFFVLLKIYFSYPFF